MEAYPIMEAYPKFGFVYPVKASFPDNFFFFKKHRRASNSLVFKIADLFAVSRF